ncbi:glycosyltransferase, partial [Brachyspira innocens]|nr:glycosyltransferase [Brachyspira innocens]
MSGKLLLKKNLIEYLVWPIPIRSIRNKIRIDSVYLKDLGYKINYNHYKNDIKGKKTFFVRNDWSVNEKEFSQNSFYNLIKRDYIN